MNEWHEKIPPQGVLCRNDLNNIVIIVPCDKNGDDYYALNDDEDCISNDGDGYNHKDLTPLTVDEIGQFMPWQPIEHAPRDGSYFGVITEKGFLNSARYTNDFWLDGRGEFVTKNGNLISFVKWLPLPKN